MNYPLLSIALAVIAGSIAIAGAQENVSDGDEAQGRVQYTLILPEEKTPELVKDVENNPFEAAGSTNQDEGTTEENQVRDILMQLPAVGGASGSQGMRVLLGGMRLAEGSIVPPVLPDQQVSLKVKSITSTAMELMWIDKKPTNLPPKILTIPLDLGAKVRRQLPGAGARAGTQASIGTIRRNGVPILGSPSELGMNFGIERAPEEVRPPSVTTETIQRAIAVTDEPMAEPRREETLAAVPPPAEPAPAAVAAPVPEPLPPTSSLPQASVLRMLFGNHAPAGK